MKPRTLLILIAATAVSACQTYVSNLAIDPSFTYQDMAGSGMVVESTRNRMLRSG